jgi:hypothetical protein
MREQVTADAEDVLRTAAQDPVSATAKANALNDSARQHKRAEGWHRRRAREDSQKRDAFLAMCEEFGIEVVLEDGPTSDLQDTYLHTDPDQRSHSDRSENSSPS